MTSLFERKNLFNSIGIISKDNTCGGSNKIMSKKVKSIVVSNKQVAQGILQTGVKTIVRKCSTKLSISDKNKQNIPNKNKQNTPNKNKLNLKKCKIEETVEDVDIELFNECEKEEEYIAKPIIYDNRSKNTLFNTLFGKSVNKNESINKKRDESLSANNNEEHEDISNDEYSEDYIDDSCNESENEYCYFSPDNEINEHFDYIAQCIDYNKLKLTRNFILLGKGSFGEVYKIYGDNKKQHPYVLKKICGFETKKVAINKNIFFENFSHENLIKYYYKRNYVNFTEFDKGQICEKPYDIILMEYFDGMSLNMYKNMLNESQLIDVFFQLSRGINYLHERGLAHRDLKPDNILVNITNEKLTLKIIDLDDTTESNLHNDIAGTPYYLPPECFKFFVEYNMPSAKSFRYKSSGDIWSLGCIIYEMYTNKILLNITKKHENFMDMNNTVQNFDKICVPLLNNCKTIPLQMKNIMLKCLTFDESKRPKSHDLFNELFQLKYQVENKYLKY